MIYKQKWNYAFLYKIKIMKLIQSSISPLHIHISRSYWNKNKQKANIEQADKHWAKWTAKSKSKTSSNKQVYLSDTGTTTSKRFGAEVRRKRKFLNSNTWREVFWWKPEWCTNWSNWIQIWNEIVIWGKGWDEDWRRKR